MSFSEVALATPDITNVVIRTGVVTTCPSLSITTINNYPSSIVIADSCLGSSQSNVNKHVWRLSENGTTSAAFSNADSFRFCADLVIRGSGVVGLQVSPWWSQDLHGLFVIDTGGGFIFAQGGRLPFFAFTRPGDPVYVNGTAIHLEVIYLPNGLSQQSPATIEYRVTYRQTDYSSGPLPFAEGDPADDPPYGRWGILNDARMGGYFEFFTGPGGGLQSLRADWSNICFDTLTVAVTPTTWQHVKALYR
jgi:hypothetical protein